MCDKQETARQYPGNPVGGGEVLAGEYRPTPAQLEKQLIMKQMEEQHNRERSNMRLRDGGDSPTPGINQTLRSGAAMSGSARVVHEANRELANQCSQAPLVDTATRVVKESVHSQHRVHQAIEYLDLAAKYPDIARMIELARNGLY